LRWCWRIAALLAIGIRESTEHQHRSSSSIQVIALVVLRRGAVTAAVHPASVSCRRFRSAAAGVIAGAALVFFAYIGFDNGDRSPRKKRTSRSATCRGR